MTALTAVAAGDVAVIGVNVRDAGAEDRLVALAREIIRTERRILIGYQQAAWRERVYAITRGGGMLRRLGAEIRRLNGAVMEAHRARDEFAAALAACSPARPSVSSGPPTAGDDAP